MRLLIVVQSNPLKRQSLPNLSRMIHLCFSHLSRIPTYPITTQPIYRRCASGDVRAGVKIVRKKKKIP